MAFLIQSNRVNESVRVTVSVGTQEKPVLFRRPQVVYSSVLTADMRTQAHLDYISCTHVKEVPEGVELGVAVDPNAVKKSESVDETPPTKELKSDTTAPAMYTAESLAELKKEELQAIATKFKLDPNHKKSDLVKMILKAQKE